MSASTFRETFQRDGVLSPVPILSVAEATAHRRRLEAVEASLGSLHYRDKVHTALPTAASLVTHPAVLDAVEACIGPDILLYNSTYIIKEAGARSHVSWHQDLTYWGLADPDAQVSLWLALSPATEESGCMIVVPGSHHHGAQSHVTEADPDNVLLLGQQLTDIPDDAGQPCALEPGQASFHHGWTVHRSLPNVSGDRRIGLNAQFLAPHNRFTGGAGGSAILVRGEDRHGHFETDPLADVNADDADAMTPDHVAAWTERDQQMKAGFTTEAAT